ncbi:MAG: 4Fe-4S dicluster domain-containing protein [Candidatus Omnitrophica bacterium]|nr:4Fe-4S dicluster domain-containing protein [Candidatus Omnitrophota bacterium]
MSLMGFAKVVLKNLFTGPVTEKYPFVPKVYPQGARGSVNIELAKCIFCGICQKKCPTAAIVVTKEPKAWEIDRLRCISCNYCVEVCPKKCLALDTKYAPVTITRTTDKFSAQPVA